MVQRRSPDRERSSRFDRWSGKSIWYVKGSVFATLEIGEQRHLEEIARLVDKHLKKVHDDELARMTKDAAKKD